MGAKRIKTKAYGLEKTEKKENYSNE